MMKYLKHILIVFVLGAGAVYGAAVWQGTDWIADGNLISAQKTQDNFDYLYERSLPNCGEGEIVSFNSGSWSCIAYATSTNDTDIIPSDCQRGQVLAFDGDGIVCQDDQRGGVSNRTTYTSAGTYTYEVPEGVDTIRVDVAGAGGGGGTVSTDGARGGDSRFSGNGHTVVATGGPGGLGSWENGVNPNKLSGYDHVDGSGGDAHIKGKGGAGGMGGTFEYQTHQYDTVYDGHAGNPGGWSSKTISVVRGQSFQVTVGAGGSGGSVSGNSGQFGNKTSSGAKGADGYVIISW